MAAHVSTLARMLSGCSDKAGEVDTPDRRDLITRDLLGGNGGFTTGRSKELDLDLKVPVGWEKRLDLVVSKDSSFCIPSVLSDCCVAGAASGCDYNCIHPSIPPYPPIDSGVGFLVSESAGRFFSRKSGEVYFHRSSSSSSATGSSQNMQAAAAASRRIQDLNLLPQQPPTSAGLFSTQPSLDLRLFAPSSTPAAPVPEYRSVCTLDKVKSALDRLAASSPTKKPSASHHPNHHHHMRSLHDGDQSSSPTSSSTTASSLKTRCRDRATAGGEEEGDSRPQRVDGSTPSMVAAGCPSCLSYVLISTKTPRCPRCGSAVPVLSAPKKPRLDLDLNFRN